MRSQLNAKSLARAQISGKNFYLGVRKAESIAPACTRHDKPMREGSAYNGPCTVWCNEIAIDSSGCTPRACAGSSAPRAEAGNEIADSS